jgi:hypothetical protein
VATRDERFEELRRQVLAADIEPVSDPEELARLSIRSLHETLGEVVLPDRSEVDIRLHGPGVQGQEIPVREAAAILSAIQETIASLGQALTSQQTVYGPLRGQILRATELRLSPDVRPGSVIFHLIGTGEEVSGNEAVQLTGTETLVDSAMRELFTLVQHSEAGELETGTLAEELRRFGPRVAKHLSELVSQVVRDEIDVDFAWRSPRGQRRRASLQRRSAKVIRNAIKLNEVDVRLVELVGTLITVSKIAKAELQTEDQGRLRLSVDDQTTAGLGRYYNHRVTVLAEQTTRWSATTGQETRAFRLLDIRRIDDDSTDGGAARG